MYTRIAQTDFVATQYYRILCVPPPLIPSLHLCICCADIVFQRASLWRKFKRNLDCLPFIYTVKDACNIRKANRARGDAICRNDHQRHREAAQKNHLCAIRVCIWKKEMT